MQTAQQRASPLDAVARVSALPPTDPALIKQIASGDKWAMDVLFRRHSVPVYRFAGRIVKDAALAEDIVSEVFLEVWRNAERFGGKSQVSTWLLAIARNKALSALRRRSKSSPCADLWMIPANSEHPGERLDQQDRRKAMRSCLERLPLAHREVIDLVYYHEMSVAEAAQILAAPVNTVKTRMFHARRNLAAALKSAGIDATI
jgi:RNA polymerase sigma-70 factor (ECF subfamily)